MKRPEKLKRNAFLFHRNRHQNRMRQEFLALRNFSDVEDGSDSFKIIRRIASNAGRKAAAEARAAGIARVYLRKNRFIKKSSTGGVVSVTPKIERSSFYINYKPFTVLNAVKK